MQHYWSLENIQLHDVWLTIGSFDGVHIGHQSIIREVVEGAKKDASSSVVLTFHPHPDTVLKKKDGAFYLTSPQEQAGILGELGIDFVITYPFNKSVANTSTKDFIDRIYQHLHFKCLCIGHDFALGKNREGDLKALRTLGKEYGFHVRVIDPLFEDGKLVSSSRIRAALHDGDLRQVNRMLGRPYQINGKVVHGDGRGHTLGIPTANFEAWKEKALPKSGVYACIALVDGVKYPAVTNIGIRPTFDHSSLKPIIESHIINFDQNIYDHNISLLMIDYIREEKRFENVKALISQIEVDICQTKTIFAKEPG